MIELHYKASREGIEQSDSESFENMEAAQSWIAAIRADGWDVSAWDDNGNDY